MLGRKTVGRIIYRVFDTAIVILCLPFYAVVTPIMLAEQWARQRHRVRIGLEVTHWPARDLREDYVVVDTSRVSEGLVGIRRRKWGVLGTTEFPPYGQTVEFIAVARFWVPDPIRIWGPPPPNE